MEIRSKLSFFDEHYTFEDSPIDCLSVVNVLNRVLIGEYFNFAAKSTGYLVLHNFLNTCST